MILLSVKSFGQTERAKEAQEIIDAFIKKDDVIIQKRKFADTIENLSFEGFEKLTAAQLEYVRIQLPKYILIDTSIQKQNDKVEEVKEVEKKTKKKGRFSKIAKGLLSEVLDVDQNASSPPNTQQEIQNNQVSQIKPNPTVYSDLKLLWGDSYFFNCNETNSYSVSNEISLVNLKVTDYVLKKFKGETSGMLVYTISIEINGVPFNGFIQEQNLNKKNDLRIKEFNSLKNKMKSQELSRLERESENWLDTNFLEVFPDGKLYFYKIRYGMCNGRYGDTIAIESLSYSNVSPTRIIKSDFPSKEHHIILGFEYIKEINLFDAIYEDEILIDSIYYSEDLFTSDYRWWNKDESVHFLLDVAKNDILSSPSTKNIYNRKYFTELVDKEWQTFYSTARYDNLQLIQTIPMRLSISKKKYNSLEFKVLNQIEPPLKSYLEVSENEEKVQFSFDRLQREFDLRVDKKDFKFVQIIPFFLGSKHDVYSYFETPNFQPSAEFFKEELVDWCVDKIEGFFEYKNADAIQAKRDEELKNKLKKKYGAKYVEAAYEGRIIVGMHEDLLAALMKYWEITDRSSWKDGYKIYCKSKLDYSKKISVHVKNKKVTYVSNY